MHDIFETLEQTEMWYGQDNFPYRIDEMEQSHRYNVQNFLRRRAVHLHARFIWRENQLLQGAPDEVQRAHLEKFRYTLMSSPEEWLNNRPFMKALEQAIKNEDTVDGEVYVSHLVDEKELANVRKALTRYVDKTTGEITHDAGTITMTEAVQRTGAYRMKATPTGQLLEVEEPEAEVFKCFVDHSDCNSEEECTENRFQDWKNSHDTTACGGMQNGCQLCAHIW